MTIVKDAGVPHNFLKRAPDKTRREIAGADYIHKASEKCISTPTLSLFGKEMKLLDSFL